MFLDVCIPTLPLPPPELAPVPVPDPPPIGITPVGNKADDVVGDLVVGTGVATLCVINGRGGVGFVGTKVTVFVIHRYCIWLNRKSSDYL